MALDEAPVHPLQTLEAVGGRLFLWRQGGWQGQDTPARAPYWPQCGDVLGRCVGRPAPPSDVVSGRGGVSTAGYFCASRSLSMLSLNVVKGSAPDRNLTALTSAPSP